MCSLSPLAGFYLLAKLSVFFEEVLDESLNTKRNEPNKMAQAIGGRQRIHKLAKLSVFFEVRGSSFHRNNKKTKQNKR